MDITEIHIIKDNNKLWEYVDKLCFQTKCLRNKTNFILRENFFSKRNHKYISYYELDKIFKRHKDLEKFYRNVPRATIAQQCLRMLDKEWKSFFESCKARKNFPEKFNGIPKPPKYKKGNITYTAVLLPQEFKVNKKNVILPEYLGNHKIHFHNPGRLKQIRIVPCSNKVYKIELIFEVEDIMLKQKQDRYLSIDLGVDNFAAITTNIGTNPILLNGKGLKSINQYYNKKISSCKSILPHYKNGKQQSTSKLTERLYTNRNNKIKTYMHRFSRFVVDYADKNNIDTIVIGYNKNWKQESDLGKKNNQNFQQLPFLIFVNQIKYKAEMRGIEVVTIEESYTSGTSFLDKETPEKQFYNKSRRIERGLFKSNSGILINADVNASYQILTKYLQKLDKNYVVEGLRDVISKNLSYALNPNKITIDNNTAINKFY